MTINTVIPQLTNVSANEDVFVAFLTMLTNDLLDSRTNIT